MAMCRYCGVKYRVAAAEAVRRRGDDRSDDVLQTEAALRAREKCEDEMARHEFFCACATCQSFSARGCVHGLKHGGLGCRQRVEDAEKLGRIQEFELVREDILRKHGGAVAVEESCP